MAKEQEQKELEEAMDTKYDVDNYEFGMSQNINNQDLLSSQQEALMMLRDSITSRDEISPTEAFAASALAIAPAIGGYFAGRKAGNVGYISPWMKPETILDMELPSTEQGIASGMEAGSKASSDYLKQLKSAAAAKADQEYKVGALQLQQANLQDRSQASIAAANARQAQQLENQKELEVFKHQLGPISGGSSLEQDLEKERRLKEEGLGRYDKNEPIASPEMKQNFRDQLISLLPNKDDPEALDRIDKTLATITYQKDLTRQGEILRRTIESGAKLSQSKAVALSENDMGALADADNAPKAVEYISQLYDKAVGPSTKGWLGAQKRKVFNEFTANDQNQLRNSLTKLAAQLAKSSGDTKLSDQDIKRWTDYYISALDNGNFKEVLQNDIDVARSSALARLEAKGRTNNYQANELGNQYKQKWGMGENIEDEKQKRLRHIAGL